ncbi:MAG: hypothetical protein RDA78_09310 [Roseibium sp.]|uniref:hypothetical protein n=1 Tax=Roseibium sp. TaxID=1936156 RepID=UPI003D9C48D2
MLKRIWHKFWTLLNEENSFRAIVFLTGIFGSIVVTVVGGAWVAFTWYYEKIGRTDVGRNEVPVSNDQALEDGGSGASNSSEHPSAALESHGAPQFSEPPVEEPIRDPLQELKFFVVPSQLIREDTFKDASMSTRDDEVTLASEPAWDESREVFRMGFLSKIDGDLTWEQEELIINNFSVWLGDNNFDVIIQSMPFFDTEGRVDFDVEAKSINGRSTNYVFKGKPSDGSKIFSLFVAQSCTDLVDDRRPGEWMPEFVAGAEFGQITARIAAFKCRP